MKKRPEEKPHATFLLVFFFNELNQDSDAQERDSLV